jgi:hypothetical protein
VKRKTRKTFHLASIFKKREKRGGSESGKERWKKLEMCVCRKSAGSWNQEEETFFLLVSGETSSPFSPSSNYFSMNVDLAFMLPLSKKSGERGEAKDSAVCVISAADATLACAVAINQLKRRENGRSVLYIDSLGKGEEKVVHASEVTL